MSKARKMKIPCSDFEIIRFGFNQLEYMEPAARLRIKVFVKEQKVPVQMELDGDDPLAWHYSLRHQGKMVGTARCINTEDGFKFERFAVKKSLRGQGLGKQILLAMLDDFKNRPGDIYLFAQTSVISFYRKYGFSASGKVFKEAGIDHIKMIYKQ